MSANHLTKLVIKGYKDDKYSVPTGYEYVTLVNPESYSEAFQICYDREEPMGASSANLKYEVTKPTHFDFTFLFDATGVIPNATGTVEDQISQFKSATLNYLGDVHSPPWVKLLWGTALVKGRLVSLDIEFTLFAPDGTPLRARGKAGFEGSLETGQRTLRERTSSPDLTHVRIVKEGDTLPALAREIYGDASRYLEVARANRLPGFRNLPVGKRLKFPPIAR